MTGINVLVAQVNPMKGLGSLDYNLAKVGAVLEQAAQEMKPSPDVIVFPETALSGYFVEGAVAELALTQAELAEAIARQGRANWALSRPVDVVIGFYERAGGSLYNAAAYLTFDEGRAEVLHVHRKKFRPTYGVFDETRFVAAGKSLRAFDTRHGRAAILICEDAWHSLSAAVVALQGAEVLYVPAASPARGPDGEIPANAATWQRVAVNIAEEHGLFVVHAGLVGSEAGKVFTGHSLIVSPKGEILAEGPVFEECLLAAALDPWLLAEARAQAPMLENLHDALPDLMADLQEVVAQRRKEGDKATR